MGQNVAYQYFTPATGNTVSPADWCEACCLNPAAGLSTLTLNMPKQPRDGQPFTLNSTQAVTTFTQQVTSGTNQTLLGGLSAIVAGVQNRWVFNASINTWMPG